MSQDNTGSDSMDQLSSDTVNKLLSNLTNDKTTLKEVKLQSSTSDSDTMPIKELLPPKKSVKFDENANVTKQKSALKKTAVAKQPVEIKDTKITNEVVEQKNIMSTTPSTVKVVTAGLISLMGFTIPLQTLYLLIVCVLIAIGLYYISNKQTTKKKSKKTDDDNE